MPTHSPRQSHIDALKTVAAQLIVLHHFALYGPLSDGLAQALPEVARWLRQYALMAVHVFLAMGGFLAARSLGTQGPHSRPWWAWVAERYARLMPPFAVALLLAMVCSALARQWLADDVVPLAPSAWQVLAHLVFVQDIADVDSLSAGVWYVAMDFHLFALLALLMRGGPRFGPALVLGLAAASMFVFNRHEHLDEWAIYFFGSYGLGAAAWLASRSAHAHRWLAGLALLGLLALAVDLRERLLLALATALALGLWERHSNSGAASAPSRGRAALRAFLAQQGAASFALFLLHFPVLLLANAAAGAAGVSGPSGVLTVLMAAWLASMLSALAFHRWVEQPLARRLQAFTARLGAPRTGAARHTGLPGSGVG